MTAAPIADKVYQVTLIIGQQLNAKDINFELFGQPDWGVEFGKAGSDHCLAIDNSNFEIQERDDNIVTAGDTTIKGEEAYVSTIDCSTGMKLTKLRAAKQ